MPDDRPIRITTAQRPPWRDALRELWGYRELVRELTKRSIQLRYKNSVLGVLWSLATPLMFIFMITVVRKVFLRQDVPNYSAYLFPAMFAWTFFTMAIPDSCTVLLEHAAMIRKVYFPRELLPVTVVASNLFHLLIAMGLALAYFAALRIFPQQINSELLLLVLIIPAQCAVILGLGLICACLNVLFEDIKFIVTMAMQVLLYAVPLLYLVEDVAAAAQHSWANPLLDQFVRPHLLQLYLLNPFAAVLVLYQKALLPPVQQTSVRRCRGAGACWRRPGSSRWRSCASACGSSTAPSGSWWSDCDE